MKVLDNSILVFAAKYVGEELLQFLIKEKAPVAKVFVANSNDQKIITLAKRGKIPVEIYHAKTQEQLIWDGYKYDWLLNLWSPHILSLDVLKVAKFRLNCHPSLVPHCQGNDNAAWVIRKQLPAGVSLIEMTASVDAGHVYAQRKIQYNFPITGRKLHQILQEEMITLFKECWPAIFKGDIHPRPQRGAVSLYTRRQTNEDRVKKSQDVLPLYEFINWALAHDFSPETTAEVEYGLERYIVRCVVEKKKEQL
ncbi:MAG: hypothetical protein Q7S42_01025 [Candidatus Omnitrophota bacterium]|nr:hypothetical protein [Candidatus Omnitrophota bacterium]